MRVYSVTSEGLSAAYAEGTFQTLAAPMVPQGLVSVTFSSKESAKISVTWSALSNNGGDPVNGYKLFYKVGMQWDGSGARYRFLLLFSLALSLSYLLTVLDGMLLTKP